MNITPGNIQKKTPTSKIEIIQPKPKLYPEKLTKNKKIKCKQKVKTDR